jgi:hypothetical protein
MIRLGVEVEINDTVVKFELRVSRDVSKERKNERRVLKNSNTIWMIDIEGLQLDKRSTLRIVVPIVQFAHGC